MPFVPGPFSLGLEERWAALDAVKTDLDLKDAQFKLGDCGRMGFRQPERETCLMRYSLLGKFRTKKYLQGKWIFFLLWKKLKEFCFVLSSPI